MRHNPTLSQGSYDSCLKLALYLILKKQMKMAIVIGSARLPAVRQRSIFYMGWTDSSCCRSDKVRSFVMQSAAPACRRSGSFFYIEWTDSSYCRSEKVRSFVMQRAAPACRRSGSIFYMGWTTCSKLIMAQKKSHRNCGGFFKI